MLEALLLELGAAQYSVHEDGIWRQRGTAPYTVVRQAPAVSIGAARGRWSLAYTHLGRVRSDALATVADSFYVDARCAQGCDALGRYMGSGYVHGLHLRREWGARGPWRLEAGVYVYQPRWKVDVQGWWPGQNGGTPADGLSDFTVRARDRVSATPTLGLIYGHDDTRLAVRVYTQVTNGGDYNSLYHGPVVSAAVQMRFR